MTHKAWNILQKEFADSYSRETDFISMKEWYEEEGEKLSMQYAFDLALEDG